MNIKQLFIVASIGMMFAACSSRDDYSANDGDTIKLRATVVSPTIGTRVDAGNTGIINDNLPNGTEIKVRFFEVGTANFLDSEIEDWYYITGENGSLSPKESEPVWGNTNLDIVAYYPTIYTDNAYIGGYEGGGIYSDQSTLSGYNNSDLLMAQLQNQAKVNGPITLPFKHMLSKIVVVLQSGTSGLTVTDAKNVNLYAQGDYDIHTDVGNIFSIVPQSDGYPIKLGDYKPGGVAGVIPPQNIPISDMDAKPFITFEINGITYNFDPSPSITLKGGYQYTFTLEINNNTVKAKGFSIEPWETSQVECSQGGNATY